jgi:hypothetical protein
VNDGLTATICFGSDWLCRVYSENDGKKWIALFCRHRCCKEGINEGRKEESKSPYTAATISTRNCLKSVSDIANPPFRCISA